MEMDYMEEEYEQRITKTLEEIDAIPGNVPIVIWTGENAEEQTAMRYFMYLLREKPNDVLLITCYYRNEMCFEYKRGIF